MLWLNTLLIVVAVIVVVALFVVSVWFFGEAIDGYKGSGLYWVWFGLSVVAFILAFTTGAWLLAGGHY